MNSVLIFSPALMLLVGYLAGRAFPNTNPFFTRVVIVVAVVLGVVVAGMTIRLYIDLQDMNRRFDELGVVEVIDTTGMGWKQDFPTRSPTP